VAIFSPVHNQFRSENK